MSNVESPDCSECWSFKHHSLLRLRKLRVRLYVSPGEMNGHFNLCFSCAFVRDYAMKMLLLFCPKTVSNIDCLIASLSYYLDDLPQCMIHGTSSSEKQPNVFPLFCDSPPVMAYPFVFNTVIFLKFSSFFYSSCDSLLPRRGYLYAVAFGKLETYT